MIGLRTETGGSDIVGVGGGGEDEDEFDNDVGFVLDVNVAVRGVGCFDVEVNFGLCCDVDMNCPSGGLVLINLSSGVGGTSGRGWACL